MTAGVRNVWDGASEFREWATDARPRIRFGLPFLDEATNGGMARSEVAQMIAFSSVGKTNFALNVIRKNPDVPVLFMSLEMSWRMVVVRLAAMQFGVTTTHIENLLKTGAMPKELAGIADLFPMLVCDDTPALSLKDAKVSFNKATEQLGKPPRLVVWDYMELIGGAGLMGKAEQIDKTAQKLKDWTREFDCSSLVLHQVGKGESGGWQPLSIASGRYGGFQAADFLVGAYAPRLNPDLTIAQMQEVRDLMYLQLLKSRAGTTKPVGEPHRLDHKTLQLEPWLRPTFVQGEQAQWQQTA